MTTVLTHATQSKPMRDLEHAHWALREKGFTPVPGTQAQLACWTDALRWCGQLLTLPPLAQGFYRNEPWVGYDLCAGIMLDKIMLDRISPVVIGIRADQNGMHLFTTSCHELQHAADVAFPHLKIEEREDRAYGFESYASELWKVRQRQQRLPVPSWLR